MENRIFDISVIDLTCSFLKHFLLLQFLIGMPYLKVFNCANNQINDSGIQCFCIYDICYRFDGDNQSLAEKTRNYRSITKWYNNIAGRYSSNTLIRIHRLSSHWSIVAAMRFISSRFDIHRIVHVQSASTIVTIYHGLHIIFVMYISSTTMYYHKHRHRIYRSVHTYSSKQESIFSNKPNINKLNVNIVSIE